LLNKNYDIYEASLQLCLMFFQFFHLNKSITKHTRQASSISVQKSSKKSRKKTVTVTDFKLQRYHKELMTENKEKTEKDYLKLFFNDNNATFKSAEQKQVIEEVLKETMSQVHNETDAQLIILKYKKNTMKRKKKASYRSKKIMCFSLKVLISN